MILARAIPQADTSPSAAAARVACALSAAEEQGGKQPVSRQWRLGESAGICLPKGLSAKTHQAVVWRRTGGTQLRSTTMVPGVALGGDQGYDLRAGQWQRTIFGFSQSACARCASALAAHGASLCAGI